MLKFEYDKNDKIVNVYISGDNFQYLLERIKSIPLDKKFNKEKKVWQFDPINIYEQLIHFKDLPELKIENENEWKEYIKEDEKNQIQFQRRFLEDRNIIISPIKGKPPYEDFQLECIKKAIQQNRLALFLGMGSGKTYIISIALNQLFQDKEVDRVVIVAPSEGIYNWRRELIRFTNFLTRENIMICSAKENRNPFEQDLSSIKVFIMTYRHYLTLSDDWYKKVIGKTSKKYRKQVIPWDQFGEKRAIVLDESHNIKNHSARQTKVLDIHKNYFQYRYILTGTPTPNRFDEIYSQIRFLDYKLINKSYYEWVSEIADVGNRFSQYTINYIYKDKQKEWEDKLKNVVIRYKSEEILELPELYIQNVYAELTNIQKSIYEQLINYVITILKEEHGRLIPKELRNKFAYISLAYENASLLKEKIDPIRSPKLARLVEKFDFQKDHGKLEVVDSLVNKYLDEGHKVTIFDFHPRTLDNLAERYKKYTPIVIHGSTEKTQEERDAKIEKFKKDKNQKLLIGSFRVLSTAINLTECQRVIYFCRDFSYVNWSQSIKRFHRLGQDKSVIINPIIFEDSLDEYIEDVILRKSKLDEKLFMEESLDQSEWIDVFKGKTEKFNRINS